MQNYKIIKISGKRKSSHGILTVLQHNSGILLNNKSILLDEFITSYSLENFLSIIKEISLFNRISIIVNGGGISSQKSIIKYLILKYIVFILPSLKQELKKANILFNDTRIKERKMYGHLKSRKKKQYSKR